MLGSYSNMRSLVAQLIGSKKVKAGLSHPFLGMGPGPMELGKLAAF